MARRRQEARRLGRGPYLLGFTRDDMCWGEGFPFDVPALAVGHELDFDVPITLLAGENGTGKSTVLELCARAMGFAEQGDELHRWGELPGVPRAVLGKALTPTLSAMRPRNGYYLRAESFFNVGAFADSGEQFVPDLSIYGGVPPHEQSHGESFLALASNRFGGGPLHPR